MTNAYRKQWEIILYVSLSWLLPLQTVKATLSIWFRMCTTHLGLTSPQRPLSCHANPPPPSPLYPSSKIFFVQKHSLTKDVTCQNFHLLSHRFLFSLGRGMKLWRLAIQAMTYSDSMSLWSLSSLARLSVCLAAGREIIFKWGSAWFM